MKNEATFEQFLNNFNRTTGLNLTTEEVNNLLGANKKPFFMKKADHEADVEKKRAAMKICLNNIMVMRAELVDDEMYYNDIVTKYNVFCAQQGKSASCQKQIISEIFKYASLPGRNPHEWEEYMKNRITYLVHEIREIRKLLTDMKEGT